MVNAQQWLNSKFPNQDAKRKIKQLYIYATNSTDNNNNGNYYFYNVQLEGELNLEEFCNLEYIQIQGNSSNLNNYQKLTSLKIANCRKLRTFYLYYNNSQFTMDGSKALTTLYLQHCQNLTNLQLSEQLSKLTNLQIQNCSNLTTINGLDNLITLNSLNLNNCGQLTTLNGLDGLYRLTNFTMVGGRVTSLENFNNSSELEAAAKARDAAQADLATERTNHQNTQQTLKVWTAEFGDNPEEVKAARDKNQADLAQAQKAYTAEQAEHNKTKTELTNTKVERDSQPNITLAEYQQLLDNQKPEELPAN
ncbi:1453_t:CDS:1 [Ambispora leptoticha]|uniref:1453_t:CDS:1 n=1 Tax=Ambispora leptoticha TaxID=144679 RepID=A0A9N9HJN1_9GLOM|nr:1453_t:CDS:1 [Ambispora leptoticha]